MVSGLKLIECRDLDSSDRDKHEWDIRLNGRYFIITRKAMTS